MYRFFACLFLAWFISPFKIASVYHSRIHLEIHLEILSVTGKYDKCSSGTKAIEYKKDQGDEYRIYFE